MKLYIVATPIGNLQDITLRALDTLKSVDFILCEDTRHTLKLLNYFEIKKPLLSYHQHSKIGQVERIIDLLKNGKNLALVSDAGTPGISDPGNMLIKEIVERLNDVEIIPIPGASALGALASVAGLPMDKFVFMGFPPNKKGRKKYFEKMAEAEYPVIFYESKYRIIKALEELAVIYPEAKIVVGNDLTKMFEKIYRGTPENVLAEIKKDTAKGEYAVAIKI